LLHFPEDGFDQLERAAETFRQGAEVALHIARLVDQVDDLQSDQPLRGIGDLDAELLFQMLAQSNIARQAVLVIAVLVGEIAAARADAPICLAGRLAEIGAAFAGAVAGVDIVVVGIDRGILGVGQMLAVAELLGVEHAVSLAIGGGRFGRPVALGIVGPLQQRVALQLFLDIGRQVLIRQFQQLDCLLELRRHDEGLRLAQI
jgi:hypothetical protein